MQTPTLAGIERAAERLSQHLAPTPLARSDILSRAMAADVWLKNETVTPIASFKIRGALNAILQAAEAGATGAATSSTGNHGQGVAYAARQLHLTADIFLPAPMNPVKAAMIAAFGATLHEIGGDIDEAKEAASDFAAERGIVFLDDGEDVAIMEGAGTVALEVVRSMPDVDCLVVPMGGGNLCAGCATALKAVRPSAKTFSVQSIGSPAVTESYHARASIERPTDSIADGLLTRIPPKLALRVLWERLDDAWLVSDDELLAGVQTLAESVHVLVEPAGAAALAGAWSHRAELAGKRVVLLLSGANITLPHLRRALARAPLIPLPGSRSE